MPHFQLDWLRTHIAHRGLHNKNSGIIENTLTAVGAAIDNNFPIEIDIQPSADFTPMVFHDETLDRLTEAMGPLISISPNALKAVIFKQTEDTMPTLTDLLEFVSGRIPILIEIKLPQTVTKQGRHKYARKIAKALSTYDGHTGLMSFDPRIITILKRLSPNIPRGLVATDKLETTKGEKIPMWKNFQLRHLLWHRIANVSFIAYDIRALPAVAPFVARTFYKMPLLTWTVRNDHDHVKARRWADGIIFEGITP